MNEKFNHHNRYEKQEAEKQRRYDSLGNTAGVLAVAATRELANLEDVKKLDFTKSHNSHEAEQEHAFRRAENERAARFQYIDHNAKYREEREMTAEEQQTTQLMQNVMGNL